MTAPVASSVPRAALILKLDTLGDLVLFAPALRALRAAWPGTRLCGLIRETYADIAPALAPGIEWPTTNIDPFAQGPAAAAVESSRLRDVVSEIAPDLIVAATSRGNWLETMLAAGTPDARRVALGAVEPDPFFAVQLRLEHGVDAAQAFSERVTHPPAEPDWQRNLRLAESLLGRGVERTLPVLDVATAARHQAQEFLRRAGLASRQFVVCAAAGFANVAIKTWPADRFGAVLRHLREQHRLPALLVGHESEGSHLEVVRRSAGGGEVWLGRGGDLQVLGALIAESALFVGNDTGALHLAAAVDVPVVGVYGGGTWPRFVPAARRSVAVVQPLPCFGCGWDCAFADAPCVKEIPAADVIAAADFALARGTAAYAEIRPVETLPAVARELMGAAAARYRSLEADHLARQLKIEEKEAAIAEKESSIFEKEASIFEKEAAIAEKEAAIAEKEAAINEKQSEILSLKATCDEREKVIITLDGHVRAYAAKLVAIEAEHAVLKKALEALPPDAQATARALHDHAVHIRNLDALVQLRDREISELKASAANHLAGHHDVELAKHYGKLLAEKEAVIQSLRRATIERENVIKELTANSTGVTAALRKAWIAGSAHAREKWWRPFYEWLFKRIVEDYWMQIGVLRHYDPRPLRWDERLPGPRLPDAKLPQVGLVTPSYGQEKFIERTMLSVLDQHYPKLLYIVQDGGSKDRSAEIIARHAARLRHWESVPDKGQADAIHRGFQRLEDALGPNDLMAWLNSDDLLAPGALRFVAEYFATHPEVDVIYGHRIIIDDDDRDVGRWIMPRHNPATLEWIDYVPQETLFWRKRAWDLAGGIDPSFQFALDWDLLARFQQAGAHVVRVPYFLGAFRVHAEQKTSQAIHTTGADEMRRIRTRFHGERQDDFATINQHARDARFWGAVTARLHAVGIRW